MISSELARQDAVRDAMTLLQSARYDEAISELELLIAASKPDATFFQLIGLAHLLAERPELALRSLDQAIELNCSCAESLYLRGRAYVMLERYQEAQVDFISCSLKDETHAGAHFYRAYLLFLQEKFADAIDYYGLSIKYNPENAQAFLQRGICYEELDQTERALDDYCCSIELAETEPDGWFVRGQLLARMGRFEEAESDYTRTIELDPCHSEAFYARGLVLQEMDCYGKAMDDYTTAIKLDPANGEAFYCRAVLLRYDERHAEAVLDLDAAIALDSQHTEAFIERARAKTALGDHDGALEDFNAALSVEQYPELIRERASCFRAVGNYSLAFSEFARSIELDRRGDSRFET